MTTAFPENGDTDNWDVDLKAYIDERITALTDRVDAGAARLTVGEQALQDLDNRVGVLEGDSSSEHVNTVTGTWQINPMAGHPQAMQVSTGDGSAFDAATSLEFWAIDQSSTDVTAALMGAIHVFAQQKQDAENWVRYEVTGAAVDHGNYVTIPVTVIGSNKHSSADWQDAVVVLTIPIQALL